MWTSYVVDVDSNYYNEDLDSERKALYFIDNVCYKDNNFDSKTKYNTKLKLKEGNSDVYLFLLEEDNYKKYYLCTGNSIIYESGILNGYEDFSKDLENIGNKYLKTSDYYFKWLKDNPGNYLYDSSTKGDILYNIRIGDQTKKIFLDLDQKFSDYDNFVDYKSMLVTTIADGKKNEQYLYKLIDTKSGEIFDVNSLPSIDNSFERYWDSYHYVLGQYDLEFTENKDFDISELILNEDNYDFTYMSSDGTELYYISGLDNLINYSNSMSNGYLFVRDNFVFSKSIDLKNITIVLDCDLENSTSDPNYFYNYIDKNSKLNSITKSSASSGSIGSDDKDGVEKLNVTINQNVTINLDNSNFIIDGYALYPAGGKSCNLGEHSVLQNNGNINLINNSSLKVIGIINGTGTINISNDSKVYEYLEVKDFFGGNTSKNLLNNDLFPFYYYELDHVRNFINFDATSEFHVLSMMKISFVTQSVDIPFVSKDGLIKLSNNASLTKIANENKVIDVSLNKGTATIQKYTYSIPAIGKIDTTKQPFPLVNMNLTVNKDATLEVGKEDLGVFLSFMPGSSLINNGTINLNGSSSIYFISDENLKEIQSNLLSGLFKNSFSLFEKNNPNKTSLINNFLITYNGTGGIYADKDIVKKEEDSCIKIVNDDLKEQINYKYAFNTGTDAEDYYIGDDYIKFISLNLVN